MAHGAISLQPGNRSREWQPERRLTVGKTTGIGERSGGGTSVPTDPAEWQP